MQGITLIVVLGHLTTYPEQDIFLKHAPSQAQGFTASQEGQ